MVKVNPVLLNFCFWLNVIGLSQASRFIHWSLWRLFRRWARESFYNGGLGSNNYLSSVWVPYLGCLAFRRADKSLQFWW